ncbi:MAG: hypothetical protein A3D31_01415 [Candidatus Fluviicola riflensis]|nr:MAG: hypothetical protein CHH17_04125 [Candidatus Fluviicola riflensis]OGS76262.1 MAG: hypothetical protein A3D31_01415 [Candidatus Fluviicola riflensis]OGS83194.1 MAG: hypothetical protein A2724_00425 [Fluviicola sp. RIFCSPHIGHO2_01_FULL_43_53]OGS83794.1 MAG: hypothetical protein A3E30_18020 [Fluviicola sp. RIFCSPHIGHO2_12_FULL_43_24]
MKKIFLVAVNIFTVVFLHAQPEAKIFQHSWAAGMCCARGAESTFSIQFPQGTFICFDSLEVEFNGLKYLFSDTQFTKSNKADLSVGFTVSFGYSTDSRGYDLEGIGTYQGLSIEQIRTVSYALPRFILIRHGKREVIETVVVEETITAYP